MHDALQGVCISRIMLHDYSEIQYTWERGIKTLKMRHVDRNEITVIFSFFLYSVVVVVVISWTFSFSS